VLERIELAHGVFQACRSVGKTAAPGLAHGTKRCAQALGFVGLDNGLRCGADSSEQRFVHSRSSLMAMVARLGNRSLMRVRSLTSPANCPQAAAISSPRVLRTVVTIPASIRRCANKRTRAAGERFRPDCGNGLNGIRLNLHRTCWAIVINSRAC